MDVIILGIIAAFCFVIGFLQLKEKGILLNNAYLFASKQERETMDKTPHYRQSGIVFLLLGLICAIEAANAILQIRGLTYGVVAIAAGTILYALISSVTIEKRKRRSTEWK